MLGQLQLGEHPVDHGVAVGTGHVRRQTQLRGVAQGLAQGQSSVQHVVLRDHADARSQGFVLLVDAPTFEGDLAGAGMSGTGHYSGDGGFPGARRSDDRGESTWRSAELDVADELFAVDREADRADVDTAGDHRLVLPADEFALGDHEVAVADGHHVAVGQLVSHHAATIDVGAVDAA